MPLMSWNSNYSVKVDVFDNHHKKLVGLINQLHDSMNEGKGKEALALVLNELIKYADYHFTAEEDLMKKHKYPEFAKHRTEHSSFANKVKEIQRNFEREDKYAAIEAFTFLKDWLLNHILNSDKKYSTFFNNLSVK